LQKQRRAIQAARLRSLMRAKPLAVSAAARRRLVQLADGPRRLISRAGCRRFALTVSRSFERLAEAADLIERVVVDKRDPYGTAIHG
jgi:hypothetical protein